MEAVSTYVVEHTVVSEDRHKIIQVDSLIEAAHLCAAKDKDNSIALIAVKDEEGLPRMLTKEEREEFNTLLKRVTLEVKMRG